MSAPRNPSMAFDWTWTDTYWPLHTPLKREILTLSTGPSTTLEGHRVRQCAFWKKFLPQLGNLNDLYDGNVTSTFNEIPRCATRKDILPMRQDMLVLHTVAFVLFVIAFVLLVVKISFMVASVMIKACSQRPSGHQRSEMTNVVASNY